MLNSTAQSNFPYPRTTLRGRANGSLLCFSPTLLSNLSIGVPVQEALSNGPFPSRLTESIALKVEQNCRQEHSRRHPRKRTKHNQVPRLLNPIVDIKAKKESENSYLVRW